MSSQEGRAAHLAALALRLKEPTTTMRIRRQHAAVGLSLSVSGSSDATFLRA